MRPFVTWFSVCFLSLGASLLIDMAVGHRGNARLQLDPDEHRWKLQGKKIVAARCAGCHDAARRAPPLPEAAEKAVTRVPGLTAEEYLRDSILDPNKFRVPGYKAFMPEMVARGLTEDDIRALVYYLVSLREAPNLQAIKSLDVGPLGNDTRLSHPFNLAQIKRGQAIFENKAACIKCHPLRQSAGQELFAPSITGIGLFPSSDVLEAILEPSKKIVKGYEQVSVVMQNGITRQGRLLTMSDDRVSFLELKGDEFQIHHVDLSENEDGERPEVIVRQDSPMPGNYNELLSVEEKEDLMAFLRTLVSWN